MDTPLRPFRFRLPATARLPAQTCVFWASAVWLEQGNGARSSLLAFAPEVGTWVCTAFASMFQGSRQVQWSGFQGRHVVEVIQSGSYLMSEAAPGLWAGIKHDSDPSQWLTRMVAINGQDLIVKAMRGVYLDGPPWEDLASLLSSVKKTVEGLLGPNPDWVAIARQCERFILAGFSQEIEVQHLLAGLWEHEGFKDPWTKILEHHRIAL